MKLISSSTSPYAQKVRVVAIEKDINLKIENVVPTADGASEVIQNPLGKVPTLILDSGELIFDSPVICSYLDNLGKEPLLTPTEPDARLDMERTVALADGTMDCAFSMVMERKRPDAEASAFWLERWQSAIERSVKYMDARLGTEQFNLGTIACACALNYLNFRLPEISWQTECPTLASWHSEIIKRRCFTETVLG